MFCVFIKVYYRKRFSGSTSGCSDSWSFQSIIVPHGLLLSLLLLFLCPPCDPPSVAARSQACNMIRPGQTSHWGAAGGSYTENIAEQSEVELQQKGKKKKMVCHHSCWDGFSVSVQTADRLVGLPATIISLWINRSIGCLIFKMKMVRIDGSRWHHQMFSVWCHRGGVIENRRWLLLQNPL